MTTKVTIEPAHHHVLVAVVDDYTSPEGLYSYSTKDQVLAPGDKPFEIYATTTRTIRVVDLEPTDPRTGYKPKPDPKVTPKA